VENRFGGEFKSGNSNRENFPVVWEDMRKSVQMIET
jgi:hypothetical protein